jgi:hypothetical protein
MDTHPYFRRSVPKLKQVAPINFDWVDLQTFAAMPPYPKPDSSGALPDWRPLANSLFDGRAAAGVSASVGNPLTVAIDPPPGPGSDGKGAGDYKALLESKFYGDFAPPILMPTAKCLAAMAYLDYFQGVKGSDGLQRMVSQAILKASPGWCGTFGPDVGDQANAEGGFEGNYDITQMWLLPLAYSYYDELPDARERLITLLLARGRIHRASIAGDDDAFTSGGAPSDWSTAGFVSLGPAKFSDVPETENHVLAIATARYLTNQLLYQRFRTPNFDNRRNGDPGNSSPDCLEQVLGLLRNVLRDGCAEYNSKPYGRETRRTLLNLCSYAYDAEVRLGARMVLDFLSTHYAVSSNDLRRIVPFRRRNELPDNGRTIPDSLFMDISLLDAHGADPLPAHFALLAGNTRAYRMPNNRVWPGDTASRLQPWAITPGYGQEMTLNALSAYRLPPSIHDLFVNDLHRRFYQRLQRHPMPDIPGGQHNCDSMEIYSGSPSYLITAGSKPTMWVIPGRTVLGIAKGYEDQNLGFATTTSFMPTGMSASTGSLTTLAVDIGMSVRPISLKAIAQKRDFQLPVSMHDPPCSANEIFLNVNDARDLIQFGQSSDRPFLAADQRPGVAGLGLAGAQVGGAENYGVAPDFVCGFAAHLPAWTGVPNDGDGVFFVNKKSHGAELAGFFLAIHRTGQLVFMEALDTWLHPEVSFEAFQAHVASDNPGLRIQNNQEALYTTFFGNKIRFVIWGVDFDNPARDNHAGGARILNIEYAAGDPSDTMADAGNATDPSPFLSGTVLKSTADAVIEIHNAALGTKIVLDWSDPLNPIRISEDGEVEQGGRNHEVWVDFSGTGPPAGDFFSPFHTIADAANGVADGGVIKIMAGITRTTEIVHGSKRIRLAAPIGGVTITARQV